jgi:hypothetical protein
MAPVCTAEQRTQARPRPSYHKRFGHDAHAADQRLSPLLDAPRYIHYPFNLYSINVVSPRTNSGKLQFPDANYFHLPRFISIFIFVSLDTGAGYDRLHHLGIRLGQTDVTLHGIRYNSAVVVQ